MGDPTGAVQRELQAAYARAGEAYMAKDADAVMRFVAPGFVQTMPDGRTLGYEEAEQLLREWFATTDAVTLYEVRIGALKLEGVRAVADIVENVATTFADPTGRRHERWQTNTAQVTWARAPHGWQIEQTDYRTGHMTIDGR
jgi:ketosteroid isomerase-like protein